MVKKPARSTEGIRRNPLRHLCQSLERNAAGADPTQTLPRRRPVRARVAALSLLAALSLGRYQSAGAEEALPAVFVFLQVDVKSSALEQALQKELPGLTVTVFGRLRDFQDAVATKNPDGIVAIAPLLELAQVKPTLQGVRGGKEWEPYMLVMSAGAGGGDDNSRKLSLAGKTVGIVDLLGRDGTQAFAATALGTSDVKVKRVAKIEDLLPLLEFSAADAVLIPSSAVKRFTERTRLTMTVRDLPNARVGSAGGRRAQRQDPRHHPARDPEDRRGDPIPARGRQLDGAMTGTRLKPIGAHAAGAARLLPAGLRDLPRRAARAPAPPRVRRTAWRIRRCAPALRWC